jgi:hypothetical protein
MGISPLSAISTAAAGLVASRLASNLKNGPSFLNLFAPPAEEEVASPSAEGDQSQQVESLSQRIAQLLAAAGVKTSLPFSLKVDDTGRVSVQSEHPQKDRIETALNSDCQLAQELAGISSANPTAELRFTDGELVWR